MDRDNVAAPEAVPADNAADTPEGQTDATENTPGSTPEAGTDEARDERDVRIAELEARLAEAAPILQAHKDAEEQSKSDLQRATERADALEAELTKVRDEAARARVAEKTGLSSEIVALLNGSTEEELMAAAQTVAGSKANLRTRPRPAVGAGASTGGDGDGDIDPAKLADAIRKRMPY